MHILVTGTPGSGKTTLEQYAHSIGDTRFFDADEIDKLCEWREFATGKVLGYVTEHTESGLDEWYQTYGWYWREDALRSFFAEHKDSVLCGSSENIADFYPIFDKVLILKKTEAELLANLLSPDRDNPFGQTPDQRKNLMNWQDYLINEASKCNPIILKGNDITAIYDKVLTEISRSTTD